MSRKKARELVVMVFYQVDLIQADPWGALAEAMNYLKEEEAIDFRQEDQEFARNLLTGTLEHLARIDEMISRWSKDWRVERMASLDRAILRLGTFELLDGQLPPAVVIDQAVELAKKFGDERSGSFVNAILDRVREEISP